MRSRLTVSISASIHESPQPAYTSISGRLANEFRELELWSFREGGRRLGVGFISEFTAIMIARRTWILLMTHALAVVAGYGALRKWADAGMDRPDAPEFTKLAVRPADARGGDGEALLADFLDEQSGKNSRYAELKSQLPMAKDFRGAVVAAVHGLGGETWRDGLSEDAQADRLAEVEVRVLHWMQQNPVAAMGFVLNDPGCAAVGLPALLNRHVFREIVAENGVLKSLGWLARSEAAFPTLCGAALREIRGGGGLALFVALDDAVSRGPTSREFRVYCLRPLALGDPASDGQTFLRRVGAAVRFERRDELWEVVKSRDDAAERFELLAGFAGAGGPATEWVLGKLETVELDGLLPDLKRVICGVAGVDLAVRQELLRAEPPENGQVREDPMMVLAAADVGHFLASGRDWRFEFRHGSDSAKTVFAMVRAGIPGISRLNEDAVRVALYRQLAEENPPRALALLDEFPVEKRREILFETAGAAFQNTSPEEFLKFLAAVPDAKTAAEQTLKLEGWNRKARSHLQRYGDDYVEWVMRMPRGFHQEAAMNSILWATSEQNPAAARELSAKFYPRKP